MSVEWLPEFFSGENLIDLDKVMAGDYGQDYQDMMGPLVTAASKQNWPIILPFNDGLLRFYAAAQDERMLLELRRVLSANLGSADTHAELPIIKEAINSSEKVLLSYAPTGLIRITVLDSVRNDIDAKKRVFNALKRVLNLYEQRPLLKENIKRPVGRILRDFFTACQVDDGKMAGGFFKELKGSGKLSQRNLLFLQFQVLKAGYQWEAILDHNKLESCLKGRIPFQVLRLLLKALANKFQHILKGDFSSADLEQTRQDSQILLPLFGKPPLFGELQNVGDEWKAWAIGAALNGFTDIEKYAPNDVESTWVHDLFDWINLDGKEPYAVEKNLQPYKKAEQLNLQKVKELLQTALVAPSEEIKEIVANLSNMSSEVVKQLKKAPLLYDHWINLQKYHSYQDYGWTLWFINICEKEEQVDELHKLAMKECMEWSNDTFNAEVIQQSFETGGNGKVGEALRDVMPLMLEWLQDRDIKCTDIFWVKVLELLALDDFANQQDVQLAGAVLDRLLNNSYNKPNYEDALQAVEMLLEKVSSTQSYDAVLELMDLLLDKPCPSLDAQKSLWLNIQKFALKKWHRLDPLMMKLTLLIAREVLGTGAEEAFPDNYQQKHDEEEIEKQYPDLSGKMLAIYSLTEGSAKRAKEILEALFDGILIHLNHDHVATSSLLNLAEKAEYFIFSAKSAKHQAFYAVSKIRSDLIYPKGKGASSIVREFVSKVCIVKV